MSQVSWIAQPASRSTLDALGDVLSKGNLQSLDVAAAYITSGGVHAFVKAAESSGAGWSGIKKRWLTSFDYCRTEPIALEALLSLPDSTVRVYEAEICLEHRGTPKIPFHPKTFLFRSKSHDYAVAGSGNLSRSGLSRGVEIGLTLSVQRKHPPEPTADASLKALRKWYTETWDNAAPLDGTLLSRYVKLFDSIENLKNPTPTEDDVASGDSSKGALTDSDLKKLRACTHLWIEAGNVTRNRGPKLPGNQLMLKRLSRVFFGFEPKAVPKNTTLGNITMRFGGGAEHDYTLSYSDNKMDKLNLPMPGSIGPAHYDNEFLLFRQVAPRKFELTLGTKTQRSVWAKNSKAIDGAFKMSSGREWGVF